MADLGTGWHWQRVRAGAALCTAVALLWSACWSRPALRPCLRPGRPGWQTAGTPRKRTNATFPMPRCEFYRSDAERPDVGLGVVAAKLDQLGREPQRRADEGGALAISQRIQLRGHAEVAQLSLTCRLGIWALGTGHWVPGTGHRASGIGHWALGIGFGLARRAEQHVGRLDVAVDDAVLAVQVYQAAQHAAEHGTCRVLLERLRELLHQLERRALARLHD